MTFTKNDQLMDKLFAELVKMRQAALIYPSTIPQQKNKFIRQRTSWINQRILIQDIA